MTKIADIKFECGEYWVLDTLKSYAVMKLEVDGITHSVSDSEYTRDEDGLSIAVARAKYLASRVQS